MKKLLSVVVPVYNVEKYIKKCLDSLLISEDLLPLVDVVVVNDGTPDKSAEIAREYENRYPEVFRVIDKENGGHGSAWNKGIELAQGEYLFFLDSDDWYDTQQFSRLLESLKECDTDLVFVNWTKYYAYQGKEEIVRIVNIQPDTVYDSDRFNWMSSGNGPLLTYAASTVYRTSLLQSLMPVFCERVMYDDIILQVLPVVASKTFLYKNLNIYHYLIGRPGQSLDPKVRAKRANDVTTVLKHVLSFLKDHRKDLSESSTRREWADFHYSAFATHHYVELCKFSYMDSKKRLADWDRYVKNNYPDIELSAFVKLYRNSPFLVFFSCYRMTSLVKRVFIRLGLLDRKKLSR